MLRTFKTLIIATAILSLFFLFLTSTEAFEISQMYSTYDDSENRGCLYITAYVETDSPYLYVYWYIDGVHQSVSGGRVQVPISLPILRISPGVPTGLLIPSRLLPTNTIQRRTSCCRTRILTL